MATKGIRINRARNFAGQPYATEIFVSSAVQSALLDSASLSGNTLTIYQSGGGTAQADLKGLVSAGNSAITVTNNGVSLKLNNDAETSAYLVISNGGLTVKGITDAVNTASGNLSTTISGTSSSLDSRITALSGTLDQITSGAVMDVDQGSGISVTSTTGGVYTVAVNAVSTPTVSATFSGGALKLDTRLTLKKLTTANTGYAASYQLQDGNGNPIGSDIDILKDQFLKDAGLVWGTSAALNTNGQVVGSANSKSTTAKYPFLKFEVYTNANGTDSDDTVTKTFYVPVDNLFHDYTAGNGINITDQAVAVKIAADSEQVVTAAGTSAAALSVGTGGLKVSNIQTAINYASSAAVTEAVNSAAAAAGVSNYIPKISGGTVGDLVTIATGGTLQDSAKKIVTTISGNINDSSIPTAKAVSTYVAAAVVGGINGAALYTIASETVSVASGTSGLFSKTLTAATTKESVYKVIDGGGDVIYPEISADGSHVTLQADYALATSAAETWTVYYFKPVSLS